MLIAAFGLVAAHSTSAPTSNPASPTIVASVVLTNQAAAIPPTTIFTPTQTGLYRLSVYMTETVSVPHSLSVWKYNLSWVDDAGVEGTRAGILPLASNQTPPSAWGTSNVYSPGGVAIFEAMAGQPVSYSVLAFNPVGTYSLYFTVEQLF